MNTMNIEIGLWHEKPLMKKYSTVEMKAIRAHRAFLKECEGIEVTLVHAAESWENKQATEWRRERLREEMAQQRQEILRHKWIESEKAGRDLGNDAVRDWLSRFAASWRAEREELEDRFAEEVYAS